LVIFATSARTWLVDGAPDGVAEVSVMSLPFEMEDVFTYPEPS
jgi:hypothetical protein